MSASDNGLELRSPSAARTDGHDGDVRDDRMIPIGGNDFVREPVGRIDLTADIELIHYDTACRALAEAKTVDEVKDIHDRAAALRAYARQAKNKNLEADAVEIRLRAERRVGELMAAQRETVGLAPAGRPKEIGTATDPIFRPPTLAEAGIDKHLAQRGRTLARLDERKFESTIADARDAVQRAVRKVVRTVQHEQEREAYAISAAQGGMVSDLTEWAESGFRAGVIYADPPWSFDAYSGKGKDRSAERHYDTMSLDAIKAMGPTVQALAAPDCALFLWAVMPELPGALDVIESWGFTYKTAAFVWVKTTNSGGLATGMGYWTRSNAEVCLLATRGNPKRLAMDVHQVVMERRGEHSAKPAEVRRRIKLLVGGPYLELFGRKPRPGWTVWGNQSPNLSYDLKQKEEVS